MLAAAQNGGMAVPESASRLWLLVILDDIEEPDKRRSPLSCAGRRAIEGLNAVNGSVEPFLAQGRA
jgi:hypothetical protein